MTDRYDPDPSVDWSKEARFLRERETAETVAELKEWLGDKGLSTSGKKTDLVDRVEQWFESR